MGIKKTTKPDKNNDHIKPDGDGGTATISPGGGTGCIEGDGGTAIISPIDTAI